MKLVGLIPCGEEHRGFSNPLRGLVDLTIILGDNIGIPLDDKVEAIGVFNDEPWNAYGNYLTLLARAAAHGAAWVIHSDADWTFPRLTRDAIECQIRMATESSCIGVSYKLREMWNETHYRSDGVWGQKKKVVLQKNPLMEKSVTWRGTHLHRFHNVPLQEGNILEVDSEVLHWGMNTPAKRQARRERYSSIDPKNEFQSMGYDYLVDETGMELTPI